MESASLPESDDGSKNVPVSTSVKVKLPTSQIQAEPEDKMVESKVTNINLEDVHQASSETSAVVVKIKAPTTPWTVDLIMNQITSMLPLEDLKSCRLVCWNWNRYASPVIEKRDYAVNFWSSYRLTRYLKTMHEDPGSLFFTKFCLKYRFNNRIQTHLLELGPNIKTLYVEAKCGQMDIVNFQNVVTILSATPNLEHLSLDKVDFPQHSVFNETKRIPDLRLDKLKTIRLLACFRCVFHLYPRVINQAVRRRRRLEWIEKLFDSSPNLITLEVYRIMVTSSTQEFQTFEGILEGLANLKHLCLEPLMHQSDLQILLSGKPMKLESLRITQRYLPVEVTRSFFSAIGFDDQLLKKLDLGITNYEIDEHIVEIYLPHLKNLRELTLRFQFSHWSGCRVVSFTENIELRLPQLKKLDIYEANCSILRCIFEDFWYIEELRIHSISTKLCININQLLTGLRHPEDTNNSINRFKDAASEFEIGIFLKLTLMAAEPSLRSLTCLRCLELCSGTRNARINDSTAIFALLMMQPLEILKLKNVQYSDRIKNLLLDYHQTVVFSDIRMQEE